MSERKARVTIGFAGHEREIEVALPDGEPAPWDATSQLEVVSQRIPRVDAEAKVTGRAKYTFDVKRPGLLEGRILRSPHPAAILTRIDLSRARALEGVRAAWADQPGKKILYQGQEVAAVAATSGELAEEALRLIEVEWQPRPFVIDATAARAPDAPVVFAPHESSNASTREKTHGELDVAFAESQVIVEATYRTQVQTQSALEPHGAVAEWEGDHLTVWTSTQSTFGVREQLASELKIPQERVRVLCEFMGGGFGAKFMAGHWSLLAARLAQIAKAPVKIMLSRHDEQLVTGNRPDSVQHLKLGARHDGTFVALDLDSYGTPGIGSGAGTGGPAQHLYKWRAWRTRETDVHTNTGPAQPFRAPGHPQGCFALEQAVDELAEKLGLSPIALRKRNVDDPIHGAELDRLVQKVPQLARPRHSLPASGSVKRGVGLACGLWYKIVHDGTQAQVDLHRDGRVEVLSGAQDIGSGMRTVMAQVAAEELGLPLSQVTAKMGDTNWPFGPGSGGSTTTASLAPAVRAAAFQAKGKLLALAGQPGLSAKELARKWKELTRHIPGDKLTVVATRAPDYAGFFPRSGGAQAAEVEVDTRSGQVRVIRVTAIQDCGRALNRLTAESQINGGVIQGVSYALFEDRRLDPVTGQMVNPNLEAYKIATANDCPIIDAELFDVSDGYNSTGAVGLGEPPTVPTAAAIANAVYDAIGVRIRELPITPDRILRALRGG